MKKRQVAYRDGYVDGAIAVLLRFQLARRDILTCNRVKAHLVRKLRPWAKSEVADEPELPPGFEAR